MQEALDPGELPDPRGKDRSGRRARFRARGIGALVTPIHPLPLGFLK